MKKGTRYGVLLLVLSPLLGFTGLTVKGVSKRLPTFSQDQKEEPTLDETIQWLSQNLPLKATYDGKFRNFVLTEKVLEVSLDGCNCLLSTRKDLTSQIQSVETNKYTFSIAALDKEKIYTEKQSLDTNPPLFLLRFKTKDGKNSIRKVWTSSTGALRPIGSDRMSDNFHLTFDDEENAHRVEKAFKHAVTLCQGKKEPF